MVFKTKDCDLILAHGFTKKSPRFVVGFFFKKSWTHVYGIFAKVINISSCFFAKNYECYFLFLKIKHEHYLAKIFIVYLGKKIVNIRSWFLQKIMKINSCFLFRSKKNHQSLFAFFAKIVNINWFFLQNIMNAKNDKHIFMVFVLAKNYEL